MGRKSRLKRERRIQRKQNSNKRVNNKMFLLGEHDCSVYRFFKEEWQADALARGEIWLSTLETCRTYEDPAQGDPEEAHETYNTGFAVGGSGDPSFVEVARRGGIHIGPGCSNITLNNNTRKTVLPDAFVLCTTTDFSPDKLSDTFGNFCVEITNPEAFFFQVTTSLEQSVAIKEAVAGRVIYKDRYYTGLESPPGPIGFVKPTDIYMTQREFRLLWIPENSTGLVPFLLKCPETASLCRRIA